MARYVNGVLDLRSEETPPLIKYSLVVGDTFRRVIAVNKEGADYSNATASIVLRDSKPPTGEIVYTDVTIPLYDVVAPTEEVVGSGKFAIDIPATATALFPNRKVLYGHVRLLSADNTIDTLFTLELTLLQA